MISFHVAVCCSFAALLGLTIYVGRLVQFCDKRSSFGILIDSRQRFSLNRLQVVIWTLLVLSTMLGLLFSELATSTNFSTSLSKITSIPPGILGLLGISAASTVVAGAVKENKNLTRTALIAAGADFRKQNRLPVSGACVTSASQIILEEEGASADKTISITKFQNLIFTLVLAVIYVAMTWQEGGYPEFDSQITWLIGVSHAGYVGGKVPNRV